MIDLHSVEFRRPEPQLKTVMYIAALRYFVLAGLIAGGWWAVQFFSQGLFPGKTVPLWLILATSVPFVLIWIIATVRVHFFVRNHGYALRENDFLVTRGAWMRQIISVPYGRIQYSTVEQGPLLRAFGLAKVELHTASSAPVARVSGLKFDDAEALKERLVERGNARLAGL